MDGGQKHRPELAKMAQDKLGMVCQDTSGGGESTSCLLVMGEQCSAHLGRCKEGVGSGAG